MKQNKKSLFIRLIFAYGIIMVGLVLSCLKKESRFLGNFSVGLWLIYVGFLMIIIVSLRFFRKDLVDERMQYLALKASRLTFISIVLFAFIIMILDGIQKINIPYSYFMSYFISGIALFYFVSYKILLRIK